MSPADPLGLLPGTLDLLILKTLSLGPLHGYGIARHIAQLSSQVFQVEEGSLYPALQRLRVKGWVKAAWKQSPTGRRARYYDLTALGERQLASALEDFDRRLLALKRVLKPA
jgi:transcriptional regulator